MIEPCRKMIVASKAAVPTIEDQAAALQLANFAKQVATCLANLISAASDVSRARARPSFLLGARSVVSRSVRIFGIRKCH